MDIVIDTSVIIAVVTKETSYKAATEITVGHTLIAPGSVHWEIGNALSTMIKRGRISLQDAQACVESYVQIPLRLVDVNLQESIALANELKIYAYDAYLLACASQFRAPLLTLDASLKEAAEILNIEVLEV